MRTRYAKTQLGLWQKLQRETKIVTIDSTFSPKKLPTAREGNVFRSVSSFCSRGEAGRTLRSGQRPMGEEDRRTPGQRPHGQTPLWKEHGTRQEVTSCTSWKEHETRWELTSYTPSWNWHLMAASAVVSMHPTGMHSCFHWIQIQKIRIKMIESADFS